MSLHVVRGAQMCCSQGSKIVRICLAQSRNPKVCRIPVMIETDTEPFENIPSFGRCEACGQCTPNSVPLWDTPQGDYRSKKLHILLDDKSMLRCAWGGIITFVDSGQIEDCLESNTAIVQEQGDSVKNDVLKWMQECDMFNKPYPVLKPKALIQLCKDRKMFGSESTIYQDLVMSAAVKSQLTFDRYRNEHISQDEMNRDLKNYIQEIESSETKLRAQ